MSHQKRVRTLESFFAPNRSQSESEKNDAEEEQHFNQKKWMRIGGNRENHELSRQLGCEITRGCAMNRRQCSAFFVGNLTRQTPLHQQKGVQMLESQLCNDIKTVKNMRMLLMKKLSGIRSATHSAVFLEHSRKPSSQQ